MSDVEWIKITVDMFDNRKIKHLRHLPDGNNIVLIWVMLLTMAGRCNAGGMIFLTENIAYTPKMLADELGFEENTVRLALEALERLGMVKTDGFLTISGWGEYQNTDGLNRIREQTRQRVARCRERQKALPSGDDVTPCNVTCNATVTLRNETDKEEDQERDIEYNNNTCSAQGANSADAPSEDRYNSIDEVVNKHIRMLRAEEYPDHFNEFWSAYPRKKDKGMAYKAYMARIRSGYKPEDLIAAAKAYAAECRRNHTATDYIKHPKTFVGSSEPFVEYIPKHTNTEPSEKNGNPYAEYELEILGEGV